MISAARLHWYVLHTALVINPQHMHKGYATFTNPKCGVVRFLINAYIDA